MNSQQFVIEDPDWSQRLEAEYEDYMWNCEASADLDPDDERYELNGFETLSGQPYCACSTCQTREQLFFLVPRIIKAYKEGKITLNEE